MKQLIILIGIFAFSITNVKSQDIHFSQMAMSPLTLNPALTGAVYDFQANVNYRNQWLTVGEAYQTISASADTKLNFNYKHNKKAYFAVGVDFYHDRAGLVTVASNNFNLHLATHIVLTEHSTLGLGVQTGYGLRSIDYSAARWGSQYDGYQFNPLLSSGEAAVGTSFGYFDVGAGMVYRYSKFDSRIGQNDRFSLTAGFAAYHLNRPAYSFQGHGGEKLYMRFTGFVNFDIGIHNSHSILQPAIYFFQQGPAREIMIGMYWKYMLVEDSRITNFINQTSIAGGLFYRNQDALVAKFIFDWRGMGIGFSYDFNVFNSLIQASKSVGAFEIALRYVIPDWTRRPYISGGRSQF